MNYPPHDPHAPRLVHFTSLCTDLEAMFLTRALATPTATWQGLDISDRPEMMPHELMHFSFQMQMPEPLTELQELVGPNLPWAEMHFQERVSGIPYNPPPSHEHWPYAQASNKEFTPGGVFSHTYPERFWPKGAGRPLYAGADANWGIRYQMGDLADLVALLAKDPFTRQAYLPVFFPEDTGAHHGERVPCTLGYQFFIRDGRLDIVYYIRSCDFMRHFRDDVYMAIRLTHWVLDQLHHSSEKLQWVKLGRLLMHIGSFHVFAGDLPLLQKKQDDRIAERLAKGLG